jgi:hypothetical protein
MQCRCPLSSLSSHTAPTVSPPIWVADGGQCFWGSWPSCSCRYELRACTSGVLGDGAQVAQIMEWRSIRTCDLFFSWYKRLILSIGFLAAWSYMISSIPWRHGAILIRSIHGRMDSDLYFVGTSSGFHQMCD